MAANTKGRSTAVNGSGNSYAAAAAKPVQMPTDLLSNRRKSGVGIESYRAARYGSVSGASGMPNGHSGTRTPSRMSISADTSGTSTPVGRLGGQVQLAANALENRLRKLGDNPNWVGATARQALNQGHWVEEHVEEEWALRKDAIGGIDNMWVLLSSVSRFNPVCTATFVFRDKADHGKLEAMLERQCERFPRYKQVLVNQGRRFHGSVFVDDPNWDVRRHITSATLPEPAGSKELDDCIAEQVAKDWDYDKPLWEMTIIDNYKGDGLDGSAIITRGHHSLTDGQGFVMSQLYVSSYGEELERNITQGKINLDKKRRGKAKPSVLHKRLKPLDKYHNNPLLQVAMFVLFWTIFAVSMLAEFIGGVAQGLNFVRYWITDSWRPQHLTTEYLGERVLEREFATSKQVPMTDVKKLQRAFSGPSPGGWVSRALGRKQVSWWGHLTLNDIFVTVLADIMCDELEHQKKVELPTLGARIRKVANAVLPAHLAIMIPISIRPQANWDMRNWSTGSIVWLPMPDGGKHGLPMGARPMHARLHDTSSRLKVLKNSGLPSFYFHLVQFTGQAPVFFPSMLWTPMRSVVATVLELVLTSFTAVVTNIPGPQKKEGIEFANAQVTRWSASPPQAGKGTLGVGIISYAESICITVAADHVKGSPSEGVARRLTEKFALRWQQYLEIADDILERRNAVAARGR